MPHVRQAVSIALTIIAIVASSNLTPAAAPPAAPATQPSGAKGGKLPFVEFDAKTKRVRVECEIVGVETPLEFFCVARNGPDHETVLRTRAQPSHIHAALLAIGLKPGAPLSWSEEKKKWIPPDGPPLSVSVEYEADGKLVSLPANRLMRDQKTKKEMPELTWVFTGSRVLDQGQYAADLTGYIISVVNFDFTLIDIPDLASSSNETLEWERNTDVSPPPGAKVTMVLTPAKQAIIPKAAADHPPPPPPPGAK